jgi:hypothetical protein
VATVLLLPCLHAYAQTEIADAATQTGGTEILQKQDSLLYATGQITTGWSIWCPPEVNYWLHDCQILQPVSGDGKSSICLLAGEPEMVDPFLDQWVVIGGLPLVDVECYYFLVVSIELLDSDDDDVPDVSDNCPDDANPDQEDTDKDGTGDACDSCTDTDRDGFGNPGFAANTCPEDNCPFVSNPDQEDDDQDGQGNACETLDACEGMRGNVNGDYYDNLDIADLVFLVDYMFNGGPPPPVFEEADIDASGGIDIADLVYLADYMFTGGPAPLPCR